MNRLHLLSRVCLGVLATARLLLGYSGDDGPPPEESIPGTDAIAREFSSYVGEVDPVTLDDVIAREFSVFVGEVGPVTPDDVIAREFSVLVGEVGPVAPDDAIAREFSVLVGELGPPRLVKVCPSLPMTGDERDHRYIDPKAVSTGGLTSLVVKLNTSVTPVGSICVASTGGSAPAVISFDHLIGSTLCDVTFSDPIELAKWTTVMFTAENEYTGLEADICFQIAWLPGDCNQDSQVSLADATAFGQLFPDGSPKLVDLNGDGQVSLADATKFGQLWNGNSGQGRPDGGGWAGTGLPVGPSCACP